MINALSLFSGIGGIDLAAEKAGINIVAFCEKDVFCQQILNRHWPHIPIYHDVKTLQSNQIKERIDLIYGGYPCQPYSVAGNREGENDERNLWPEMYRLIKSFRPSWVVCENVKGHLTIGFEQVCIDLENEGYLTQAFIFPAFLFGANHGRERLFIVAYSPSNGQHNSKVAGSTGKKNANAQKGQNENRSFEGYGSLWSKLEWESNSRWGWGTEPPAMRVDVGVSKRLDDVRKKRIHALGNSVAPYQIYPILKIIADIESRYE